MPVGLVIVAHSRQLAEGVREVAAQMAGGEVVIRAAGGGPDGTLGTNAEAIARAIAEADTGSGVLILMDLGSAVLSAETALELVGGAAARQVRLSNAPLVEGALVAAVEAAVGKSVDEVAEAAEAARNLTKVMN